MNANGIQTNFDYDELGRLNAIYERINIRHIYKEVAKIILKTIITAMFF